MVCVNLVPIPTLSPRKLAERPQDHNQYRYTCTTTELSVAVGSAARMTDGENGSES